MGLVNGQTENKNTFTAENQPTPAAREAGQRKKKAKKDMARLILQMKFAGKMDHALKKRVAKLFGVKEKVLTIEIMMHLRQAEKAIVKSDTYAYTALLDRVYGKPSQKMEHTGEDGQPLPPAAPVIQVFNNTPPLLDSEDKIDEEKPAV